MVGSVSQVTGHAGSDLDQGNPPQLLVGDLTGTVTLEINVAVPQKTDNRYFSYSCPTLGHILRGQVHPATRILV